MSFKDNSYLELERPFCSAQQNNSRRNDYEHFCKIILNLNQFFRRRCGLKIFLIYSSGGHFVPQSKPICAITKMFLIMPSTKIEFFVEGIMRNIFVIFFMNLGLVVQEKMSFKDISYPQLTFLSF